MESPRAPQGRKRSTAGNTSTSAGHVNIGSLIFLVISSLVVVAAIMARQGFRGRDHTVGIDLGTTYSVVAISQNNNITLIPDERGHLITPSIVAFLEGGGLYRHLIGREAREYRTVDPEHTIFNAKRFIGMSYRHVAEASEKNAMPYEFQVEKSRDKDLDGDVCFRISLAGHPHCVSPVDIGAYIIQYLKKQAVRFVGHDQINKAVIAVPVGFNKRQRAATVTAFKAAGLQVTRVLEEPTAAAIAYGLHQDPSVNFILVFDFGGGTLDVSLLFVRSGSISVIDTMGDNNLGGEDMDAIVAAFVTVQVEQTLGVNVASIASTATLHNGQQPCTRAGIRRISELLKRKLSDAEHATVACVYQSDNDGNTQQVQVSMTRATFEGLCGALFDRALAPVREILAANQMTPTDIDAVVLVGGSTRLPWVRRKLTEEFGGRPPLTDIDPDVAVAYGAARTVD